MKKALLLLLLSLQFTLFPCLGATRKMEAIDRGLVAVPSSTNTVFLSWRLLGTEARDTAFNLYRSFDGAAPVRLNASPLTAGTCYTDTEADLSRVSEYTIQTIDESVPSLGGSRVRLAADTPVLPYKALPLQVPGSLTMPDGSTCTYSPNDCSVGDLDGDGQYEIVVKWDPSNSKDNSQSGYTGNVYLDAYKLDGTRLWRIDLGRNIRAGAHYTQFMVYDLNGDGRAEVACRTSDATIDGTGRVIGAASADYRNTSGYILQGPEFLSIFAGNTGAELARVNFTPTRVPSGTLTPSKSEIKAVWGDDYGNRIDRFLGCIAYLDGKHPSLVMCRGYYTRTVLAAYDFTNNTLSSRWVFDSADGNGDNASYAGQGNHNLSVSDVDGDGRDEILYGAMAIDDDGTGLNNTRIGHGDAIHVSDFLPDRPGMEQWTAHEDAAKNGGIGLSLRDPRTGEIIFSVPATKDIGRGVCGDIDPAYRGAEFWGSTGGLFAGDGTLITSSRPSSMNFMVWWDGDDLREILDGNFISKWNPTTRSLDRLLTATDCSSNNTTKATPCLSADLYGDWREEVIWRTNDNSELRIYSTPIPSTRRLPTLMHDPHYRESIVWQNVAYNQPPHTSFYLGEGMAEPPVADITTSTDTSDAKLVNISARATTGTDQEAMIVGFYTQGDKLQTLVRAIGPTLADHSVVGAVKNCRLELFSGQTLSEENTDWGKHLLLTELTALMARTGAFALSLNSLDASLMPDLAAGGYTAYAKSETDEEGVALVEVYADPLSTGGRLVNVSARAFCGDSFQRLVAGFVIQGTTPRKVLIRAVGPGLAPFNLSHHMEDPFIELYRNQTLIASNEDWGNSQATADRFAQLGAFPLDEGSKDAALYITLLPGLYTAEIYSKTGESGVVLAEVYDAQ